MRVLVVLLGLALIVAGGMFTILRLDEQRGAPIKDGIGLGAAWLRETLGLTPRSTPKSPRPSSYMEHGFVALAPAEALTQMADLHVWAPDFTRASRDDAKSSFGGERRASQADDHRR